MKREVMNLKQLCAYLRLPEKEVLRRIESQGLPGRRVRGEWIFHKVEVDDWLQRTMPALPPEQLSRLEEGVVRAKRPLKEELLVSPLLLKDSIRVGMAARTKASVLRELVEIADGTGLVYDRESLAASLKEREDLGSTALGGGVAIPHPRVRQPWVLAESFLVAGVHPRGIPFGGPDGSLVDLFFMPLCVSDQEPLQVLARLVRMLQDKKFLQQLREAGDAEELLEVFRAKEKALLRL